MTNYYDYLQTIWKFEILAFSSISLSLYNKVLEGFWVTQKGFHN